MTLPSVTLVRRIKATPARVWAAVTDPAQIAQWWGPDAGPTLRAEADVRPGGRYSIVFRMLNGQEGNPTGTYREIVPEQKLVFTWELAGEPDSVVTFLLRAIDHGTELTVTHEQLPSEPLRVSHARGWAGFLEELSAFLGDV